MKDRLQKQQQQEQQTQEKQLQLLWGKRITTFSKYLGHLKWACAIVRVHLVAAA